MGAANEAYRDQERERQDEHLLSLEERRERRERHAPVCRSEFAMGAPDSVWERKLAAVGSVLARRLPGVEYMAPEILEGLIGELVAAAETGI